MLKWSVSSSRKSGARSRHMSLRGENEVALPAASVDQPESCQQGKIFSANFIQVDLQQWYDYSNRKYQLMIPTQEILYLATISYKYCLAKSQSQTLDDL